jgi:hypothetical protein
MFRLRIYGKSIILYFLFTLSLMYLSGVYQYHIHCGEA